MTAERQVECVYSPPDVEPVAVRTVPHVVVETRKVDVDTFVDRPDLGDGFSTFVAAGELVPDALVHLPRRARGEAKAKRSKR